MRQWRRQGFESCSQDTSNHSVAGFHQIFLKPSLCNIQLSPWGSCMGHLQWIWISHLHPHFDILQIGRIPARVDPVRKDVFQPEVSNQSFLLVVRLFRKLLWIWDLSSRKICYVHEIVWHSLVIKYQSITQSSIHPAQSHIEFLHSSCYNIVSYAEKHIPLLF